MISFEPSSLATITMLTGKRNSHFDLHTGTFIVSDIDDTNYGVSPLLAMGYRYQKPSGGFVFNTKIGIIGPGIDLGYAF